MIFARRLARRMQRCGALARFRSIRSDHARRTVDAAACRRLTATLVYNILLIDPLHIVIPSQICTGSSVDETRGVLMSKRA
jgi:hypothetical protein